ncbi:MAG: hypothetical protein IPM20_03030 [Gammaproteobacteria bacterium]|nr:hypothetical protein [Gammaproteobacteria bacterium]
MSRKSNRRHGGAWFARIPVGVLEHQAVTTLSHAGFRVLVLLAAMYRGRNNGALGITPEQAAKAGIGSRNTLYRALAELGNRQLIIMTHPASRVPARPTMWAITWLAVDDTPYSRASPVPSHAYRSWLPPA